MTKHVTVSRANKRIRELQSEAETYRMQSRRGLIIGLATLGSFILLIIVEQLLAGLGIFGDSRMTVDNVTICLLMFISFVSVHFWRNYSKGHRKYKESLYYIEQYRAFQGKKS